MSPTKLLSGERRTPKNLHADGYKELGATFLAAILVEAAILAAVLHIHQPPLPQEAPRPVMEAAIVKPKPTPPPPPPPVIKKIVKHAVPKAPPRPAPKPVAPPPPQPTPRPEVPTVAAPPAPSPSPAPAPAAAVGTGAPGNAASVDIAIECPVQVKPETPPKAIAEGLAGEVTARATIRNGHVVAVDIVHAQPARVFDDAVRRAMRQYQCKTNGDDSVVVEQTFEFSSDN